MIGVKPTVITSVIFTVGLFNLKKMNKWRVSSFFARKSSEVLELLWGDRCVEKHWSRIAKCFGRLRT